MVLFCNAPLADRRAVTEAAGTLSPAAEARAARALEQRKSPDDVDIPALEREFKALMGEAGHG